MLHRLGGRLHGPDHVRLQRAPRCENRQTEREQQRVCDARDLQHARPSRRRSRAGFELHQRGLRGARHRRMLQPAGHELPECERGLHEHLAVERTVADLDQWKALRRLQELL
ncbi:MAG: hypothetical protein EB084_20380 [Proteobacteria bacterium]|nr:hypothetical protein [Pseudomonadota bacterium]